MDLSPSKKFVGLVIFVFLGGFLFSTHTTNAASLSVNPTAGTFTVGSTFDVPIYLNTENQSINAVSVFLKFPADKIQLVSPSAGQSIIGLWAVPPRFNNQQGTVELQGLIPNGINTSNGLITTLTFRVKAVGQAVVKLLDESKVLLNDGQGTDALEHSMGAIYQLVLPPPAGPLVASQTHPDSTKWYANSDPVLNWAAVDETVEGYSYLLNTEPTTAPDDISEGDRTSVNYKSLADGLHYFHIKALRSRSWGGITHFALEVDKTPPAEFTLDITPSKRTTRRQPVFQWSTTDQSSGLDHYELKLVPLNPGATDVTNSDGLQPLFIEAQSPYVPQPLDFGRYDLIVRAYDRAGNFTEVVEKLAITKAFFKPIGETGLEVGSSFILPWLWLWIIFGIIILGLWLLIRKIRHWHGEIDHHRQNKSLPAGVKDQLEELKRYRAKYGQALMIFFLLGSLFLSPSLTHADVVSPPVISVASRSITNEDIFYLGGRTEYPKSSVLIYLQNLASGETTSYETTSNGEGDWFYRHHTFLSSGRYQLWVQGKLAEESSPPSPQITIEVERAALQFGVSRLSYATIFLTLTIVLFTILVILGWYVVVHGLRIKKKRALFLKEIREAEESVRRGFAILRRDIMAELAVVKKAKLDRELEAEEKQTEEHLLKDLQAVERYIGREIWEAEQAG